MNHFPHRSVRHLAMATLVVATAHAQTPVTASAAIAGTTSSVRVLNVGRATPTFGTQPGLQQELWSEGTFLGYTGSFYRIDLQAIGSSHSYIGLGGYSLEVGGTTVRSRLVTAAAPSVYDSLPAVKMLSEDARRQYVIGGLPIVVSGNVAVDLGVQGAFGFPATAVSFNGNVTSNATGKVGATMGGPLGGFWSASQKHSLQFGTQKLTGQMVVYQTSNYWSLDYEMGAMRLWIEASLRFFGGTIATTTLVNASRAAINVHFTP